MRRSVFAAWALALIASSAHAFLPVPSAAPALIALRPAASVSGVAKRLAVHAPGCACGSCRLGSGHHASGCACGSCSRSTARAGAVRLSMGVGAAELQAQSDKRIMAEASSLGGDSKTYCDNMNELFPGAIDEEKFIESMSRVVMERGFNPKSSINLVSTCRDEICRPFGDKLDSLWGESFNIASLGGFVFCGKTGFGAGMAHSPQVEGKERYVFWVAPHIAFGTDGPVGKIWRPGRESISSACGALIALNNEIDSAQLSVSLDPMDTEMSLVRQSVLGKLSYGQQPNLIGITYAAHDCILESVKKTAKLAAPASSEYVIISGIQIHGALGKNYWWPGSITHVAGGVETDISGDYEDSVSEYRLDSWLKAEALAQVQQISGKSRVSGFFSDLV